MGFSIDRREAWMDDVEAMTKWMALFASDPEGLPSPSAVEVSSEVYARQEGLWTRIDAVTLRLASGLAWRNLPPGAVVGAVGAFDTAFGDSLIFSDLVPAEPVSYPAGGTYFLPAGEYEVRIL